LQYFEDALEEEASKYLHGFALAPKNYNTIIKQFKSRFSNVDLLSQAYHADLEAIPECPGSWREQQQVLGEIVKIIANLKMIGVDVNKGNVRALIMRKFPESTLLAAYYEAMFTLSQSERLLVTQRSTWQPLVRSSLTSLAQIRVHCSGKRGYLQIYFFNVYCIDREVNW
jgi:hypothetical protein